MRFLGRGDLVRKVTSATVTADRALLIRLVHQALPCGVWVALRRHGIVRLLVPTPADLAAVMSGARLPFRGNLGFGAANFVDRFLLQ